jgi:tRNA (mo5U34)-methyltransferase
VSGRGALPNSGHEGAHDPVTTPVRLELEPEGDRERAVQDLQAEIDAVTWYHEFDFGHGLAARPTTPDVSGHRRVWRFIEDGLAAVDFRGKSVLDIGCWDGYWSFYAERHGTASVLATDDLTQNWAAGDGLLLAKRLLNSRVEVKQDQSVYELTRLGRTFDVILCLGVYYHLHDPFYALTQIRHCSRPGTLVVFEGEVLCGHGFAHGREPGIFIPSSSALNNLLRAVYFEVRSQRFLRTGLARWAWSALERLPGGLVFSRLTDRAFTICEPFTGANNLYDYEPPFGLGVYDDRYQHGAARPI